MTLKEVEMNRLRTDRLCFKKTKHSHQVVAVHTFNTSIQEAEFLDSQDYTARLGLITNKIKSKQKTKSK